MPGATEGKSRPGLAGGGTGGAAREDTGTIWSLSDHENDADEIRSGAAGAGAKTRWIFSRVLPGAVGVVGWAESCDLAVATISHTLHVAPALKVFCTACVKDIDSE
jgi:hypothetical protein